MDPPKGQEKKSFSSEHAPVRRETVSSKIHKAHSENVKPIQEEEDLINSFSVNTILRQTLDSVNKAINEDEGHQKQGSEYCLKFWSLKLLDDKRKLRGKKSKFLWKVGDVQICLRVVLSDKYLRFNESGYFVELDSGNVDMLIEEQKSIQQKINKSLDDVPAANQTQLTFMQRQYIGWLNKILIECHREFFIRKLHQRQPGRMVEFNRRKINSQYIIYPSPFAISWNPQGNLCVTKNKGSTFNKPIIGSIHSFKNFLEDPSKNRFSQNPAFEEINVLTKKKQEEQDDQKQAGDIFSWQFEEEVGWCIFGEKNSKELKEKVYFQNYSHEAAGRKRQTVRYEGKKVPLTIVPNISIYSPKLKSTYLKFVDPNFSSPLDMTPGEKLKIYYPNSKLRDIERSITYLCQKTKNVGNGKIDICEALMSNQFQGYKEILDSSVYFQQLFPLSKKYQIVRSLARQKLQEGKLPENVSKLFILKYLMVENEFFHFALEDYLKEHFKKFKMVKQLDFSLGSQSNFNDQKSEEYFLEIVSNFFKFEANEKSKMEKKKRKYEKRPQKYDDPSYSKKNYAKICSEVEELKLFLKGYSKQVNSDEITKEKSIQNQLKIPQAFGEGHSQSQKSEQQLDLKIPKNVNYNDYGLLIVRKRSITPLNFKPILTQQERNELASSLIPLLWAKQFNNQQYEYKIIKKALIANSKIINFLTTMNKYIEKLQNQSTWKSLERKNKDYIDYIKQFSDEQCGRSYSVTCKKCDVEFVVYTIRQLKQKEICSRCRYQAKILS